VSPKSLGFGALLATVWLCAAPSGAQDACLPDSACRFKKPNVLVVLDYSSSMVGFEGRPAWFPPGQTATTRWDAQLDALHYLLRYDDGFFADNARIGLTRFAHDPALISPGTVLGNDVSFPPITDGFAIDIPFDGQSGEYLDCRGSGIDAEVEVLRVTPPPPIMMSLDPTVMMLTWTRGALRSAHELIDRTRASHAGEAGEDERSYRVVLMTDGDWTCPDAVGQNCDEDPAPEAALLRADGIEVNVVAFGDATMQPSLDEVALQGGTGTALDATSPQGIVDALGQVLDDIRDSVIVPECTASLPRVLIVMDGSSSMIAGDAPGETNWDKARFALTGNPAAPNSGDPGYVESVLDRQLDLDGRLVAVEDVLHLGMIVFARANEQTTMVELGPCNRDNIAWAMDPRTSCAPPGCSDPYAGFPLSWTVKNSDSDRDPPFLHTTRSFMPACNQTPNSDSCVGQIANTFTGQGLEAAHALLGDYRATPGVFKADARTRLVAVLITDGRTSEGSSSVQAALQGMVADGIDTYVIGFGAPDDLDSAQLAQYARWGNTGSAIEVDPTAAGGASALADALEGVVRAIDVDGCCVLADCSVEPEPPDPRPVCGDGRVEGGEVCDDGEFNAHYGFCGGRCDGPHLLCGDGRVDLPETCDDGNSEPDDGCEPDCKRTGEGAASADDDAGRAPIRPVDPAPPLAPRGGTSGSAGSAPPRPTTPGARDAGVDGGRDRSTDDEGGCDCRMVGAHNGRIGGGLLGLGVCGVAWLRLRRRR
jgi:cysteine-rich repeat protein